MNLYQWHAILDQKQCDIYALGSSVQDAKNKALAATPQKYRNDVQKALQAEPVLNPNPFAFKAEARIF